MKRVVSHLARLAAGVLLLAQLNSAFCAPGPATKKPGWLAELSLGVKEGYDDNLFLVCGAASMPEQSSWVTTISPKIGLNLAAALGCGKSVQALTVAYAPDIAIYHQLTSENNTAHRLNFLLTGKDGAWSYSIDNAFVFIDGATLAPVYVGLNSNRSAYSTGAPRERRRQTQDRAKLMLRYDWKTGFVRPTVAWVNYDLMTDLSLAAGYQNYADRYDFSAGFDVGWKVSKQGALTLGYRAGNQFQQQYALTLDPARLSAPSEFQRVLAGFEGKLAKWLSVTVQGGPDFRIYAGNTATHITPIKDPNLVTFFGEGTITADCSAKDALSLKFKSWQWVSSTGRLPLYDSSFELGYRRKLPHGLTLDLGARYGSYNYNSGTAATSKRHDTRRTATATLGYALNPRWSLTLTGSADCGRNKQDGIVFPEYREFNHAVASLATLCKW